MLQPGTVVRRGIRAGRAVPPPRHRGAVEGSHDQRLRGRRTLASEGGRPEEARSGGGAHPNVAAVIETHQGGGGRVGPGGGVAAKGRVSSRIPAASEAAAASSVEAGPDTRRHHLVGSQAEWAQGYRGGRGDLGTAVRAQQVRCYPRVVVLKQQAI